MTSRSRQRLGILSNLLRESLGSRLGVCALIILGGTISAGALVLGASAPVRAADGARPPRIAVRPVSPAPTAACVDSDGDGYPACAGSCDPGGKACDCDDTKAAVHPGATEICNGVDDNCNGQVDELVDPDPIDGTDNNGNTLVDEGFGFCLYQQDGPLGQCKTAGRQECHWPPDPAHTVINSTYGTMTCVLPSGKPITPYSDESIAAGNCNDGTDNNCNGLTDIHDPGCQAPEVCDGVDNDGDGKVDNGFHIGDPCSAGVGACLRNGVTVCDGLHATKCSVTAGPKGKEGAQFSHSCDNGVDDDCNGLVDLDDPACASLNKPELCNGIDDNGDGQIDEGFTGLGQPCTLGEGACVAEGLVVCAPDGTGTQCNAKPGTPVAESVAAGNCHDNVDNDCNGAADAADFKCAAAFADLGVNCSLPFEDDDDDHDGGHRQKAGALFQAQSGGGSGHDSGHDDDDDAYDCKTENIITFSKGTADTVRADLIALAPDGTELGIITNVKNGEELDVESRIKEFELEKKKKDHGRFEYDVEAPVPLLRVTGTKSGVTDVAYCGIMPYLDVIKPAGETISLSEGSSLDVKAFIPLVNVDTLGIKVDGIDVLAKLGINPVTAFPMASGAALCTTAGSCKVQVPTGCGDGTLVDVEVQNLRVEGLDTMLAYNLKKGIAAPRQVNTVNFSLVGLPPGGHIVYLTGKPIPLPKRISRKCYVDNLADTGKTSAFGVRVTAPRKLEVVASAPVHVQGTVCGGNQIASLSVNGRDVDVTVPAHQTCTGGNGTTTTGECVVHFDEAIPERELSQAVLGSAENASFKRGSNRAVADAMDVNGNRAIDADVVFGLGPVQLPEGAPTGLRAPGDIADALQRSLPRESGLEKVVADVVSAMATQINPAFVVGLEEGAVQKFFNGVCKAATSDFENKARTNLVNATFGTFSFHPDCSCDLDVPVKLEQLTFTDFAESPGNETCKANFRAGAIDITIHLPAISIQAGAHDSCEGDDPIFGECVYRTKVNATAIAVVKNISAAFTITETQIETKQKLDPDSVAFDWAVFDNQNRPAYDPVGHCAANSAHPGKNCLGNTKDSNPPNSEQCGGECVGAVKNKDFNPLISSGLPATIECWGADICLVVEAIVAFAVDIFTFGLVDGKDLFISFLGLDFEFNKGFVDALKASKPDPFGLDLIKPDPNKTQQTGFASFKPGPIDVTIQDGGLTVAMGAEFSTTSVDPEVPATNGPSLTTASTPTVAQAISVGDDVTVLLADDDFNQIFASMKEAGKLKSICATGDMLSVDKLLPAAADGGCDSLGPNNEIGAELQGICHAIRGADCLSLTSDTPAKANTKKGACVGFTGGSCNTFLPLHANASTVAYGICIVTPHRNIQASDHLFLCARQDLDPEFLVKADTTADATLDTDLILDKLNVVFGLDRGNDGYTGKLDDLKGCFSPEGDAAADCRFGVACADLDLKTRMGIDSSTCKLNEAGFVFGLLQVQPQSLDLGVLCSGGAPANNKNLLGHAVESIVTKAVADHSEKFMPPQCVPGLDLNGVLNFHSGDAKLFGLTTSGASGAGFADYLGITVGLEVPHP